MSKMDHDDRQVGRILTRREVLALFGAAAATTLAGCLPATSGGAITPSSAPATLPVSTSTQAPANTPVQTTASTPMQAASSTPAPVVTSTGAATAGSPTAISEALPACVVSPAQTEGPYFVDEKLNRSDIRSDPSDGSVKDGVPLQLTLHVSQVGSKGCTPLAGAVIDIWHCDAQGTYSDEQANGTAGKKFLRGYQVTDAKGAVQFQTIYPGWYQGRTVHIHFKVRSSASASQAYEFTSQLYFDDAVSAKVFAQAPYANRGQSTTKNAQDGIYQNGGSQLTLTLAEAGVGFSAVFDIGLNMA